MGFTLGLKFGASQKRLKSFFALSRKIARFYGHLSAKNFRFESKPYPARNFYYKKHPNNEYI